MKDLVIPKQRIMRELLVFASCFIAALVLNIYAIIRFKTEWQELITTLHITLAIAVVIFIACSLVRLLGFWLRRMIKRKAAES